MGHSRKRLASHLAILEKMFQRLKDAGMQVNFVKSTLCSKEVEFLGFLLKESGIQPTCKRIKVIIKIAPPKNVKTVQEFLGAINFIKNHIPNRARILAPNTNLTKKDVPFSWGEKENKSFNKAKAEISNSILCTYPNLNKRFIIYPGASQKYTIGAMLTQKPTEYSAKFEHLAGEFNTGADGLSRLPMTDELSTNVTTEIYPINELNGNTNHDFPLSMKLLREEQTKDTKIQEALQNHAANDRFSTLDFRITLVHTIDWKIIIPTSLQHRVIDWYRNNLLHPGSTRTIKSIAQNFCTGKAQVEEHIRTCDQCQHHKIVGKPNYGILPLVPALRDKKPFEKVHVTCAGPWMVKINNGPMTTNLKYKIFILTMVDACTNWAKVALIPTASPRVLTIQFDITWLCRYPQPAEVGYNNGKEIICEIFQELLVIYDITPKPTAPALVERLHLTLGNHLRTSIYTLDNWSNDINHLLQLCTW
eukprot:CCRYP_020514-RA/>CCRYP_020514-RA protein AED:0.13 eAED:0.09 QI:0/0/0/1/0.33/0/4/0/475